MEREQHGITPNDLWIVCKQTIVHAFKNRVQFLPRTDK